MNNKLVLSLIGVGQVAMVGAATKPNLVIIHTDEHSFRTLSCYQEQLSEEQAFVWGKGVNSTTPNIDRIAHEGAICNSYYCASPVSTPSRASMISGLYPQVTGAPKNGMHIRRDIPTLGTILKESGYATSYVGKWHLEGDDGTQYKFVKEYNGGFDDNKYMMYGGHAPYFLLDKNGEVIEGKGVSDKAVAKLKPDQYIHLTDFFTNKTIDVINRDKNKPFCVMVSIPDPHTPDYARPPYNTMYADMKPQMPLTMKPEYVAKKPRWGTDKGSNESKTFEPKRLLQYFGMVKHIDDCVGQIIESLEKNGILDNTILIFTSDHGDMFYEHNRNNKGVPYEASARIPFVIRYPKAITKGKVVDAPHVNVDFTPTMLGLMGVKTDAKFHGTDRSEDFTTKNKSVKADGNRIVYFAKNGGYWISATNGRYKLVLDKKETPWLLDLEKDPYEVTNFYNKPGYEKISAKLKAELLRQAKLYEEPGLKGGYNLK